MYFPFHFFPLKLKRKKVSEYTLFLCKSKSNSVDETTDIVDFSWFFYSNSACYSTDNKIVLNKEK